MSIFLPPRLLAEDQDVLALIGELQHNLRYAVQHTPRRWFGLLRRTSLAHAIQGSNSIEGYHATIDDAVAAVDDEEPLDANEELWREITGYRSALTYVLQLANDTQFQFHPMLLRSMHFMMLQHALPKMPGLWRPGDIYVVNEATQERVYEGPDAARVPGLIDELIATLNADDGQPTLVRAAMAHLNFVMIHPFKDGNGRMARALQTLVLSREGVISPIFSSIEEWLGRNTQAYYQILADTGRGAWNPQNSTRAWVQFNLKAYYQQAQRIKNRNDFIGRLYEEIEPLAEKYGLPERGISALLNAAIGYKVRASQYRTENEISDVVASRDLRRMSDEGLLIPHGEKRGRYYTASDELVRIRDASPRPVVTLDPYQVVRDRKNAEDQPRLL